MTVGSVLLFFATLQLDRLVQTSLSDLPVIFSGGADAARTVLSTVAGSLITVVATIFSLTIVALQLASSSYSPRLLRNFTSDRGIQVVLGAYIVTFAYALLVLRIIRTPESQTVTTFLPVISVTAAVLLAFICVGLLIYFVHHVSNFIQSSLEHTGTPRGASPGSPNGDTLLRKTKTRNTTPTSGRCCAKSH